MNRVREWVKKVRTELHPVIVTIKPNRMVTECAGPEKSRIVCRMGYIKDEPVITVSMSVSYRAALGADITFAGFRFMIEDLTTATWLYSEPLDTTTTAKKLQTTAWTWKNNYTGHMLGRRWRRCKPIENELLSVTWRGKFERYVPKTFKLYLLVDYLQVLFGQSFKRTKKVYIGQR